MKEWMCVQVNHHREIGGTIEDYQHRGWALHTYSCAQVRGSEINHYLLFTKGD